MHKLAHKIRARVLDFAQSHPTSEVFEVDPHCSHAGYLVVSALVLAFTDGTPPNLQTCYSNQAYTQGTRDATMSYAPRISGGHVTMFNTNRKKYAIPVG